MRRPGDPLVPAMPSEMPRKPRQDRPFAQHEERARRGQRTTMMVLRFINEQGHELDRVVFSRVAGGVA